MSAPPSEYTCPISYEVMTDPVILGDGHTYERSAILEWFQRGNTTSPMTNVNIDPSSLQPNFALRAAIERWKETAAQAAGAATAPPVGPQDPERAFRVRTGGGFAFVECVNTTPLETVAMVVIDRSGSMAEPSARPGGAAAKEGSMLSRMDIVKHSLRTMVPILGSQTEPAAFGLISFSDAGKVEMPITPMDKVGQAQAEKAIKNLESGGFTNIWDGLRLALEQVEAYSAGKVGLNVQVLLLTDGEPTPSCAPQGGILAALEAKLASLAASGVRMTVSAFGFGYSLDARLLEGIAVAGGGIYGYIPDATMAGSVFINAMAAGLTTAATHVTVAGKGVGSVPLGRARTVAVPGLAAGATVEIGYGSRGQRTAKVVAEAATEDEIDNAKVLVRMREEVAKLTGAVRFSDTSTSGLHSVLGWMGDPDGGFRSAVRDDIQHTHDGKGQLMKAISRQDWFDSWGLNHLISYARAFACEQAVNFKDAAPQFFAAAPFKVVQAKGNSIFNSLPAPKSTLSNSYAYGGGYSGGAGAAGPVNMANLNNADGGCIAGHALVEMADGRQRYMSQLKRGDIVRGGFRVLCVVRTTLSAPPKMVRLSGLDITPWHPVRTEQPWKFPAELGEIQTVNLQAYYNLVLEGGHFVRIGLYDVCTLGHGFTDNHVIRHPYFGTQAVIDDLRTKAGWAEGLVELVPAERRRDPETGLICGI